MYSVYDILPFREELRAHLKTVPKVVPQVVKQEESASSSSDSSSDSSSSSSGMTISSLTLKILSLQNILCKLNKCTVD